MPIYGVKHLKIFFSRSKKIVEAEFLVYSIMDSKSPKFFSNDDPRLTFDLSKVKFASPSICMGKMLKVIFSKCMKDIWLKLTMCDKNSKTC